MIRHIVMWKLKPHAEGADRATNAVRMKELLESLRGRVPGLCSVEVGIDFSATPESADVVLVTEHDDRAALDAYQSHPEHVAMKAFIGAVREERRVVDYELK
jgi:hypothetical protein